MCISPSEEEMYWWATKKLILSCLKHYQKIRFLRIIYLYRVLSGNKDRPLTRLHLHTLAYQAILVTENSPWKNTRFAAAKASLTANRHVCASQKVWNLFKPIFLFNSLNVLMANQISKLLQPCFQRVNRTIP